MTSMSVRTLLIVAFISCSASREGLGQSWQSALVQVSTDGSMSYRTDSTGNRIPDFSYAGYRNGEIPIPDVAAVKSIGPVPGDNTAHVQSAIDEVAALPLDAKGFRGALVLAPGTYRIAGTLHVNVSGVVLRGAGAGDDSATNTIVLATGDTPHQRPVIVAGGGTETKWADQVAGTKTTILTDTVPVGSRSFRVADPAPFTPGDNIILYHPCTDAWLQAIDYGGVGTDSAWKVGEQPIVMNRRITGISGDVLTIDAPVFTTLVRSLSQAYVYRYARSGLKVNIGLERFRVEIQAAGISTDPNGDENHAWDAIRLVQVEDAWVRGCTMTHFGQAGVETATATRITIDSCAALDPVSVITGERRYNFNLYTASQLVLVSNCRTSHGRHDYVSNGSSWVSGCVFVDCLSESTHASSEGHRRWTTGLLYDNVAFRNPSVSGAVLGLYNRGDYGTGHGWAAAHSVAWRCDAGSRAIIVQKPPTAQNYVVGSMAAAVSGRPPVAPFDQPEGYIEGTNLQGLAPRSLYYAQRSARLTAVGSDGVGSRHPMEFGLGQNYPNPFNPTTIVTYRVGTAGDVHLGVYDILGREVAVLASGRRPPGAYTAEFVGTGLAAGVYLCRLIAGEQVFTRKMALVR